MKKWGKKIRRKIKALRIAKKRPSLPGTCLHVSKVNRKSKSVVFNYGTCAYMVQIEIGMFSIAD